MITTLESLQNKFKDVGFKKQFEQDSGMTLEDDVMSYGSNLLSIYYRALQKFLNENHRRYPMYVRIPFSEVTFNINTETRKIDIPPTFAQNGVGVVGDHLAEFLWFAVDRFYDMTDLMTCTIDILWHNVDYVSIDDQVFKTSPFGKYCDNEKIYFGWYISKNASLAAGNIEFAIKFYSQKEALDGSVKTEFEMNTLPAKIAIKNGINLDNRYAEVDDYSDIVRSRSIYSEIVNSLSAAEPVISPNLVAGTYDIAPQENSISFTVGAYSPDNVVVTVHNPVYDAETGDPILDANDEPVTRDQRIMTKHKADIIYNWYWEDKLIAVDGQNVKDLAPQLAFGYEPVCQIITNPVIAPDGANDSYYDQDPTGEHVGESGSTLITNIPGRYRVYIGNKIVVHENNESNPELDDNYGAIRYLVSNTVELEEAKQIRLASDKNKPYVYKEDPEHLLKLDIDWSKVNGQAYYQWFKNGDPITPEPVACDNTMNLDFDPPSRGVYYCEVSNVKNLMVTKARTADVTVVNVPRKVYNSDIQLSIDENLRVTVKVNNGYDDSEYYYQAVLSVPLGATKTNLSLGDNEYQIGDTNTFSLANRNIAPGEYTLTVLVNEITCRGTNFQRQYQEGNQIIYGSKNIVVNIPEP